MKIKTQKTLYLLQAGNTGGLDGLWWTHASEYSTETCRFRLKAWFSICFECPRLKDFILCTYVKLKRMAGHDNFCQLDALLCPHAIK